MEQEQERLQSRNPVNHVANEEEELAGLVALGVPEEKARRIMNAPTGVTDRILRGLLLMLALAAVFLSMYALYRIWGILALVGDLQDNATASAEKIAALESTIEVVVGASTASFPTETFTPTSAPPETRPPTLIPKTPITEPTDTPAPTPTPVPPTDTPVPPTDTPVMPTPTPVPTDKPMVSTPTPVPPIATLAPTALSAPAPPPQCPDPRAHISFPAEGVVLRGLVEISGSANIDDFQYYKVEIGQGEQPQTDSWHTFTTEPHDKPVSDGVLDVLDSSTFAPGVYTLRLTVVDTRGNYPVIPCEVRFSIEEQ